MKIQVTINYSTFESTLKGKGETMEQNIANFVNSNIRHEYLKGEKFDKVSVRIFEGSKTYKRFEYNPTIR